MKSIYILRINCNRDSKKVVKVNEILKTKSDDEDKCSWKKEIVEDLSAPYVDFVDVFLKILDNNYSELSMIGIQKKDISVWSLYEYDGQCNMEFLPQQMKNLGDNGITLCISCWDSGID